VSDGYVWLGILFCLSQSAMFSGLNLAFFGFSRLQLEAEAETSASARRVLAMRQDSNFLLTTILWGNVGINVLLTLLSSSVLAGVAAFAFSTVFITFFGEIFPQAYFSRNSLRMASALAPLLRMYQFLLYPVAKPSARILDAWLGRETAQFFRERVIKNILLRHVQDSSSDVDRIEGIGALNFLEMDDLSVLDEGEEVAVESVIAMPVDVDLPRFPDITPDMEDPFLQKINASGKKWVILTDEIDNRPLLMLDADEFIRSAMFKPRDFNPYLFCHRPILTDGRMRLGTVLAKLRQSKTHPDGVIENDVVLVWGENRRIITGADLLDRLLHGIH
jgi:metal transporter CNNM